MRRADCDDQAIGRGLMSDDGGCGRFGAFAGVEGVILAFNLVFIYEISDCL